MTDETGGGLGIQGILPGATRALKVGLVFAIVAVAIWYVMPREFRSEARILPADARGGGGLGQFAGAAAAVGISIPGQESPDAAFVDILTSRWLRSALLSHSYQFRAGWNPWKREIVRRSLLQHLGARNEDAGLSRLRNHMEVNRDFRTKLITISVTTDSPELSQGVAQEAVRLLEVFVMERTQSRGGNKARFVEQRLADARAAMQHAEKEFEAFLSVNRNYQISTDPAVRLGGARLETELKLRQQLVTSLSLSKEQSLLEEKNDMPILNVLDAANLPIESSSAGKKIYAFAGFLLGSMGYFAYICRRVFMTFFSSGGQSSEPAVGE